MSATVFFAVLGAALLHASWNALIRLVQSKVAIMMILTFVQGVAGLVLAMTRDWPTLEVWAWLAVSGVFHAAYKVFLTYAYEQGDLSRVYPIARGAAPLMVLLVSGLFLNDIIRLPEVVGILILGFGIGLMGRGAFLSGETRKLVPFALFSAMATAGYTIVDGMGARVAGDPIQFVAWLFVVDAVLLTPVMIALRGPGIVKAPPRAWALGSIAATASFGAYTIAIWAMTVAPIALVAALRETSILFAVLIGWLVFKEPMDRVKIAAAALIVAGVAATRL